MYLTLALCLLDRFFICLRRDLKIFGKVTVILKTGSDTRVQRSERKSITPRNLIFFSGRRKCCLKDPASVGKGTRRPFPIRKEEILLARLSIMTSPVMAMASPSQLLIRSARVSQRNLNRLKVSLFAVSTSPARVSEDSLWGSPDTIYHYCRDDGFVAQGLDRIKHMLHQPYGVYLTRERISVLRLYVFPNAVLAVKVAGHCYPSVTRSIALGSKQFFWKRKASIRRQSAIDADGVELESFWIALRRQMWMKATATSILPAATLLRLRTESK